MSLTCAKCDRVFKNKRNLESHRNRKNPCDRKCKLCGEQFRKTRQLTDHLKKDHRKREEEDDRENDDSVEVLEPIQNTEMTYREAQRLFMTPHVPLDDYNWDALTQPAQFKAYLTTMTDIPGGKQMLERVTYERYIIERSESLNDDIHDHTKMRTLCVLNDDDNNDRIQQQLVQLLCEVNAQKTEPRLHSLCKTNGGIVTYNRVAPESNDCQWISHNPSEVHEIVNSHSKRLLMFALQAGIYLLKLGIWMVHGTPVLFTFESHADGNTYVIVVHFDAAIQELRCQRNANLDKKEFYGMPKDMSPALHEKTTHLITLVEQRKQEIINTLKNVQLSPKAIDLYLNHSRKECVETIESIGLH